jgi:hypothetical protein
MDELYLRVKNAEGSHSIEIETPMSSDRSDAP